MKITIRHEPDLKVEQYAGNDLLMSNVSIEVDNSCGELVDVYGIIKSQMLGIQCVDAWVEISAVCILGTKFSCIGLLSQKTIRGLEEFILENAK